MDRIQLSKERLDAILKDVDLPELPKYLRDLLSYTGYDNYISLSEMTEDDITKIEDFGKTVLPELLDDSERRDFFGIYFKKPELFQISGDIKLLNNLRKRCLTVCEKRKDWMKASIGNNGPLKINENQGQKRYSLESPNLPSCSKKSKKLKLDLEDAELQERKIRFLKNRVTQYFNSFTNCLPQNVKEETLPLIQNITVELKGDCALVSCPKCPHKSKAYQEEDKGTVKWVTSNANRHFKTHFKTYLKSPYASTKPELNNKQQEKTSEKTLKLALEGNVEQTKSSKTSNQTLLSFLKRSNPMDAEKENPKKTPLNEKSRNLDDEESLSTEYIEDKLTKGNEQQEIKTITTTKTALKKTETKKEESDLLSNSGLSADEGAEENVSQRSTINEETFLKSYTPEHSRNLGRNYDTALVTASITPRMTPQSSRRERKLKARELRFDANQLTMTDFYQICDNIKTQITSRPVIKEQFETVIKDIKTVINDSILIDERPETFLDMLKESVLLNSQNGGKSGNRYSDSIKKLSLYFFLTAGRLAYETLSSNLPNALPSIATINRTLRSDAKYMEGIIGFEELKVFLEKRKYPPVIFVSEDQTALIKRVRYNSATNQLIGTVLPTSKSTGFPIQGLNVVNSLTDIKNILVTSNIAINAYVFMAQPITECAPAFCLALFGSDNRFDAETVNLRWRYLVKEAEKYKITLLGISSDADSRCLKAMRMMSGLASSTIADSPYFPHFQANFDPEKPTVMQDTIHIATKLKTRILKPDVNMQMGKYTVSKEHLRSLIEIYSKDKHFLYMSYLDETDKMNYEAIEKISAPCVIDLLMTTEEAQGTAQLLKIVRNVLDSFLDKSLSVIERVYKIWYSVLFLRLWRAWVKNHDKLTFSKNWITLQTYVCIELNAHSLLILIEKCRDSPELFLPWLCSSQPCETFFRSTRSMTSTFATMVNFDLLDLIHRQHRIQTINNIIADTKDKFVFPREENRKLGTNKIKFHEMPEINILRSTIEDAQINAIADAKKLEIYVSEEFTENAIQSITIPEILEFQIEESAIDSDSTLEHSLNSQDKREIESDMDLLKDINIKDYSKKYKSETVTTDSSLLKLNVKDKEVIVKKKYFNVVINGKKRPLIKRPIIKM